MKTRPVQYDNLEQVRFGAWQRKILGHRSLHFFTIYTKDAGCGRGEYAEELDINAVTKGEAIKIAKCVLEHDYEPGLKVSRTMWRGKC